MIVTEKAQRPADMNGKCFYCGQPIGFQHKDDCVLIQKKVIIRAIIEYEVSVPSDWDKEMVEFHRSESSWCASNMIDELQEIDKEKGCICGMVDFKYIKDSSDRFLKEE